MKIAFASLGAYGHLYPMMPLALACAEAGHEVVLATGEPFLGRLPVPTIPGYPTTLGLGWAFGEARARHPELDGRDLTMAMFADVTAGTVGPTLVEAFGTMKPDLVVYEAMDTGAGVAASVLGIPAAAYAIGLARLIYRVLHRATIGYQAAEWTGRGQTPPETDLLAAALIDPAPATLKAFGGETSAASIPIRSVAYNEADAGLPDWLSTPATRPRVYLTLGTVSFGAVEVLQRALQEISAADVDVLVTVGPQGDPSLLGELSDNVHVERFVAQSQVLPLVDLIVHHGGTGTVLSALECGLPQLILPQGADQFANADIVTSVGAGRSLLADAQQAGAIGRDVAALLGGSPERHVARLVQAEIAAMPSPADVVPALVELAGIRLRSG
jgi:hypothetical protein